MTSPAKVPLCKWVGDWSLVDFTQVAVVPITVKAKLVQVTILTAVDVVALAGLN